MWMVQSIAYLNAECLEEPGMAEWQLHQFLNDSHLPRTAADVFIPNLLLPGTHLLSVTKQASKKVCKQDVFV